MTTDAEQEQKITQALDKLKTLVGTHRTPGRMRQIINGIWLLDELWREYRGSSPSPEHPA